MTEKKLKMFQIKFKFSGGGEEAWEYVLKSDNTIQADNKSGGKDLYGYPDSTEVSIVISYDKSSTEINEYMRRRGWVSGAEFLSGTSEYNRSYSKEGYGVINNIIKK